MTNEQIAEKLDLMFTSINELKVSVGQIEIELKHVIEDKLKTIEKELEHQKTVRANIYKRLEKLEQAAPLEALRKSQETKALVTKILLTSLILLLFGILSRYVIKEVKDNIVHEVHQSSIMKENDVAILPKYPSDPVDDGEYCETEEDE